MSPDPVSQRIIGLTGGVASGKSTVARLFTDQGIPVLDADRIARKLREPGGVAHPLLLQRFGTDDPKKLREIIFRDSQAKADLEKLLHPLIIKASEEAAREELKNNPQAPFVIYEAAC
jgi:dephospho-CoA kinase